MRSKTVTGWMGMESKKQDRLRTFLNSNLVMLIGLVSSILGICSFFYTSSQPKPIPVIKQPPIDTPKTTVTRPVIKSRPRSTIPRLTDIEILDNHNNLDFFAIETISNIVDPSKVIRGKLTITERIIDSTSTTKIKAYNISLVLKVYGKNGPCASRTFQTTIHADDLTSIDNIKKQAFAEFTRNMPGKLACH
jgi:hypothetical protein